MKKNKENNGIHTIYARVDRERATEVLKEQNRIKGSRFINYIPKITFNSKVLGSTPNNRKETEGRIRSRKANKQFKYVRK